MKAYIDRLERNRLEMFASESASRKRGLPSEPTDGLDPAKRRRVEANLSRQADPPPLPPGPHSYAQLFTLTADRQLANFDVQQLPEELVKRVTLAILLHVESQSFNTSLDHVRSRYLTLCKEASANQKTASADDDDDYEPDFEPSEDREQILNKADELPAAIDAEEAVALGPFKLPPPPPLTLQEATDTGKQSIGRVFSMMNVLEESSTTKRQKPGLNRLAGSNYDREGWVTLITRLATRASAGLDHTDPPDNDPPPDSTALVKHSPTLSDSIRDTLWKFIIEDFRARINIAIAWLNEEWFNDQIQSKIPLSSSPTTTTPHRPNYEPNYEPLTLRLLDTILPYLDARDKLLLRFLSEIPLTTPAILARVKSLAKDPERVDLAVKAIHYLILMKPPAREICIDAVEDLWRNYEDASAAAGKVLKRWRPGVLPPPPAVVVKTEVVKAEGEAEGGGDASAGVDAEAATTTATATNVATEDGGGEQQQLPSAAPIIAAG